LTTQNHIDDYVRIENMVKDEAKKKYVLLAEGNRNGIYTYANYADILFDMIAERMQLEEYLDQIN
jgi:hypothetical protein